MKKKTAKLPILMRIFLQNKAFMTTAMKLMRANRTKLIAISNRHYDVKCGKPNDKAKIVKEEVHNNTPFIPHRIPL